MERVPEPELMDDASQAKAYAEADFSEPHQMFVNLCRQRLGELPDVKTVLDLGCGPGDVTIRFARAYPWCEVDGVDGAEAMIARGRRYVESASLSQRVHLSQGYLPDVAPPRDTYDLVISNSLLHHLGRPEVLWQAVRQCCRIGTRVFVMDLSRPDSREQAQSMVSTYAADEPEILRRDFFNSLLAAYRPDEVQHQLKNANLFELHVETPSDRHLLVWGKIAS